MRLERRGVIGSKKLFQDENTNADRGDGDSRKISGASIGEYLQERRISCNVELEEVSDATGISQSILKSLENDDREQLPAEVYLTAFYKKYASFLGLDPEEILAAYKQQSLKKQRTGDKFYFDTVVTLKGREDNLLPGIANKLFIAVIVVGGGFLLYWLYKNYLAPYSPFDFF